MNKKLKGISPYVGAVMLVAIAVTVGLFLSQWYTTMVKGKSKEYEKQNIYLKTCERILYSYYGMSFNKSGAGYFRMYIKNEGQIPITLNNTAIFGHNGNVEYINNTYIIQPGEVKMIYFPVNTSKIDTIDTITTMIEECPAKSITIEGYEIE